MRGTNISIYLKIEALSTLDRLCNESGLSRGKVLEFLLEMAKDKKIIKKIEIK